MRRNWAGNVTFGAEAYEAPTSLPELQQLVASARRVRVLGTGHSFNRLADTSGVQVSLTKMPPEIEIDSQRRQARIAAGLRYGDFVRRLDRAGLALPNLASLPHISLAGACATGTHGSGDSTQVLASSVRAVELVTADGELLTIDASCSAFPGSVVALGSLGVVHALHLDLVDTFDIAQTVYVDAELRAVVDELDYLLAAAYSVSVFTDWQPAGRTQVLVKRALGDAAPLAGGLGHAAGEPRHPLPGVDPRATTEQLGGPGPWYARLPHFRLDFTPSLGDELQSELFVSRSDAPAAIATVIALRDVVAPVLQVSEIRSIRADNLWLSPAYARDTVALHFTWVRDEPAVRAVMTQVEAALAPFDARPHWGKVFTARPAEVASRYPRFDDFRALAQRLDPARTFGNDYLDAYLSA
ncbi:FAD-binding protein [Jatrophihabitans sp.]|uniref:FAD-binding protein n=1 Tax=Jatrophihabitans sp. TaxID=1932789 RepID=UPI0030C66433|nr:FAD-binding protein [Jatrophihabitans sp.]